MIKLFELCHSIEIWNAILIPSAQPNSSRNTAGSYQGNLQNHQQDDKLLAVVQYCLLRHNYYSSLHFSSLFRTH